MVQRRQLIAQCFPSDGKEYSALYLYLQMEGLEEALNKPECQAGGTVSFRGIDHTLTSGPVISERLLISL
ncbi:hypothetical protein [Pedobacter caeni]|uniref:Uncharacterized protein n=1 Tax=Pedobacter caeni TaxID=288992 RepID=A0A1M5J4T3_9SPHI|nr:hypothetical protein [Pedobacter caeni]SHG35576.1 hypothetical protein SAMN04488522_105198 [Pedobacter caeni]